ncbi:MAG TPA: IS200/IS605 family transposase [Thermomicrobiaceae bacterium]|nr:IS200/IS605 family transposase [Thermomicrobiaceae bacterium]
MPYWRLFYHLIWATRGREPLIGASLEAEVWRIVKRAGERGGSSVYAVGGIENHVHVVVSIPPSLAVAEAVRRIKGGSSHEINDLIGGFGWQAEYGVVSFAERHLPIVTAYATNQRRHHADQTLRPILEQITE